MMWCVNSNFLFPGKGPVNVLAQWLWNEWAEMNTFWISRSHCIHCHFSITECHRSALATKHARLSFLAFCFESLPRRKPKHPFKLRSKTGGICSNLMNGIYFGASLRNRLSALRHQKANLSDGPRPSLGGTEQARLGRQQHRHLQNQSFILSSVNSEYLQFQIIISW